MWFFLVSYIYFYLKFNMTIIQNVFMIFHLQETKLNFIYLIHVDITFVLREFYDKSLIPFITCTLKIEKIIFCKFKKLWISIHELKVYWKLYLNNQNFNKKVVSIKIQHQAYLFLIHTVLLLIKDELMQSYKYTTLRTG